MIRLAKNAHQGKTFYLWRVPVGFVVVFFVFLNLRLAFITEFEGPTGHYMLGHDLDTPSAIAVKNEYEHPTESFSACILWMDDNHRLEEWLAYHYYVMKLRYVVVNVDPKSKTSPKEIFDRWNDHENRYKLNMTIVKMSDSDYIPDFSVRMDALEELILSNTSDSTKLYGTEKTNYHRFRQRQFYKACSQHLVEQNKSWTSYHDIDEFITFDWVSKINKQVNNITDDGIRKMKQPGYFFERINSLKRQFPPETYINSTGLSCLVVDRKRYCSKELDPEESGILFSSGGIVPEGFMNSSTHHSTEEERQNIIRRFDTLRYKFLTHGMDGQPKSFIDLSQRNPYLYTQNRYYKKSGAHSWETHRPMKDICKKEQQKRDKALQQMIREEKFTLSHYLGSWRSYSFRNDARKGGIRSYDVWAERANKTKGEYSHVIRPWLRGFVELVGGPEVAAYLLQDAGKFPDGYDGTSRINEYKYAYQYYSKKKKKFRKQQQQAVKK